MCFGYTGYTTKYYLDWFVPHQANKRIIDGSAHKLGIAPEKVITTVDRHGKTPPLRSRSPWTLR